MVIVSLFGYNTHMKFKWDKNKEKINIQKHGVSFEQASYVFADPYALNRFDDEHSTAEDRWVLLGKSLGKILILVVHTFKTSFDIEHIRIISARKATRKEKQTYQERCPL